jgi:hypothetical protein
VIAKAPENGKRGTNTDGLLRYLFGPGRANEHHDPHVVAAWDPHWPDDEPSPLQRGWLARLAREVDAAMIGHEVQVPGGHIYHVAISVPEVDGALGDDTWRELIEEAIGRMGFGPDAEGRGGCRWVAVNHGPSKEGNDHVHLVVNLVRGDGRVADTYRDWPRWRQWCLDVERRLGLTSTSPADKTAPRRPTRAETEKAVRAGLPTTSREYLRDAVRKAAIRASNAREFIALLQTELGVSVKPHWDAADQLSGYRVARMGDVSKSSPDGRVWFPGSRLARDLSAPKLTQRWNSAPTAPNVGDWTDDHGVTRGAERRAVLEHATEAAIHARDVLAALTVDGENTVSLDVGADVANGVAHATLDLIVATAKIADVHDQGPITTAARAYERTAATPFRVQPARWAPVAVDLRTAARRLSQLGAHRRSGPTGAAVVALIMALAGLVAEIAAWREQNQQRQQAAAAHRAAALLNEDSAAYRPRFGTAVPGRPDVARQQGHTPRSDDRRSSRLPGQRTRPSVGQPLPRSPNPRLR